MFWLKAGPPAGALSRQLQLRVLNGLGAVLAGFESPLAGAAPETQTPTATTALTSILVIDIATCPFSMPGPL
jgi:hypothetical protein